MKNVIQKSLMFSLLLIGFNASALNEGGKGYSFSQTDGGKGSPANLNLFDGGRGIKVILQPRLDIAKPEGGRGINL